MLDYPTKYIVPQFLRQMLQWKKCYYCPIEAIMAFGQTFYWKKQPSYTMIHQETLKEMAGKYTSPSDADTHT